MKEISSRISSYKINDIEKIESENLTLKEDRKFRRKFTQTGR